MKSFSSQFSSEGLFSPSNATLAALFGLVSENIRVNSCILGLHSFINFLGLPISSRYFKKPILQNHVYILPVSTFFKTFCMLVAFIRGNQCDSFCEQGRVILLHRLPFGILKLEDYNTKWRAKSGGKYIYIAGNKDVQD